MTLSRTYYTRIAHLSIRKFTTLQFQIPLGISMYYVSETDFITLIFVCM